MTATNNLDHRTTKQASAELHLFSSFISTVTEICAVVAY